MCLIFIAHRVCPEYPLVIAANRDEYHQRATQAAHLWPDMPEILAGRDLVARGTWMGLRRNGRFAAITNYRDPGKMIPDAPSRGWLVSDFLNSQAPAGEYLEGLREQGLRYNGFSLLVHDGDNLACYCNREGGIQYPDSGVHGLSNRVLDTPWPKVVSGRRAFTILLSAGTLQPEAIFSLLTDRTYAEDAELPDTGIGRARERLLSPRFIQGAEYGTRSSTLLSIDRRGHAQLMERSYDAGGELLGEVSYALDLEYPASA